MLWLGYILLFLFFGASNSLLVAQVHKQANTNWSRANGFPWLGHVDNSGTAKLVLSAGYPLAMHKCRTQDGYLLTLHQMPQLEEHVCSMLVKLVKVSRSEEEQ